MARHFAPPTGAVNLTAGTGTFNFVSRYHSISSRASFTTLFFSRNTNSTIVFFAPGDPGGFQQLDLVDTTLYAFAVPPNIVGFHYFVTTALTFYIPGYSIG